MDKHRPKRPTSLDLFPRRQAQTGSQVGDWEGPAGSSITPWVGPLGIRSQEQQASLALAAGCYGWLLFGDAEGCRCGLVPCSEAEAGAWMWLSAGAMALKDLHPVYV